MSTGSDFGTAAIGVLFSVVAITYFVRSVYKEVTGNISATIAKEHREHDQRSVKRRDGAAKLSNG
jgi:hypothetical protein